MRRLRAAFLGGLVGYAVAWSGAFVVLVSEPRLVPRYLVWSWTGGGELPTFVQLCGLAGLLFGALFAVVRQLVARPSP